MTSAAHNATRAFRRLEAALGRRRLRAIDPVLRLEVAALAILSVGFVFWQARIPLDGLVREAGPGAFAVAVGESWLFLALLAAVLAGGRLAAWLHATPAGPAWLSLPIVPRDLERHLSWNARAQALPLLVPVLGMLLAGIGLVPWFWLPAFGLAALVLIVLGARAGAWVAVRVVAWRSRPAPGAPAIIRSLASSRRPSARRRLAAPRWRRGRAWLSLWRKDMLISRRPTRARRVLLATVALAAASVVAWWLPLDMLGETFIAFAIALLAAASAAEWLVTLSGEDPFPLVRGLPIGLREMWGARAFTALLAAAVLVVAHGAHGAFGPGAVNPVFLVWLGLATLCIGLLGTHYGLTLFPNSDIAKRMLALSLGLAMVGSILIPLLGWLLLLTAVIHSARRLPRWSRSENV